MKATIKKINELVYPEAKELIAYEPKEVNLEMLLVALNSSDIQYDFHIDENIIVFEFNHYFVYWQLNNTLTEQSESTQQTIKNLFE